MLEDNKERVKTSRGSQAPTPENTQSGAQGQVLHNADGDVVPERLLCVLNGVLKEMAAKHTKVAMVAGAALV